MDENVAPVFKVWKEEMSAHIQRYTPYNISQQLMQMAALFSPGQFYYWVLNFHNLDLDYVHPGTKDVLGVDSEDFTMEKLLNMLPPEELIILKKKEALTADFLFNFLKPEQMPFYKIVYFFRVQDTKGNLHNMLHQATTLTVSDTGRVEHSLGIHTDISHLSLTRNQKVSFISLSGGPSYFNLDPEIETFDPENSCPVGALSKTFSKRELEVIKLFAEGLSSAEAAERMNISKHTVITHRKNMLAKSNCSNMTELVARCLVEGVI
ncbi:MAG: response regulator transcription factor [Candidatus Cyclobacteriaceae bacterium M2_1C_046]